MISQKEHLKDNGDQAQKKINLYFFRPNPGSFRYHLLHANVNRFFGDGLTLKKFFQGRSHAAFSRKKNGVKHFV